MSSDFQKTTANQKLHPGELVVSESVGCYHVQLFATPWTVAHQTPLSMGFSRQEHWSELPFPSPADHPDPGIEPGSYWSLPGGSDSKASACNVGDPGLTPGSGRSLEKEMATHSSTLAWKIPRTEEPGGLQSMGSQRVRHDWATSLSFFSSYIVGRFFIIWATGEYQSNKNTFRQARFQKVYFPSSLF